MWWKMRRTFAFILCASVVVCTYFVVVLFPPKYKQGVEYLVADLMEGSTTSHLLLGSSSVARIDPEEYLICGQWLNRGIGNAEIHDILLYLELTPMRFNGTAIVIYAGENDVNAFAREGRGSLESIVDDYKRLLQHLKALSGNVDVHILSIKPSPARRESHANFKYVNVKMQQYAEEVDHIYFHDSGWREYMQQPNTFFVSDGIHFTPLGYPLFLSEINALCPAL